MQVVVIGDPGTGKSNLVVTLATKQFPENEHPTRDAPLPASPPTTSPIVPITIIDTSSSPEQKPKLIAECQAADAVVLTCACERPATLERLSSFWLPELRRLQLAPVILVDCKLDLRDEQQISLEQVSEVFYYAVKVVLHPTVPLFDQEAQSLKPRCVRALKRIFILCDHDRDGALSDVELNDFQHSIVADDQSNGSGVDNKSTICHLPEDEIHHYSNRSIVADDHSNGSGVDNISTICYLPEDEIRHYKNEKESFLCILHYYQRYFAYRKGLVKLDFIQSNCDPEEALKRFQSSTRWSEMQDHELRRCLETHTDLLKEHEMSKMDAASSKSEYENVALEKINMELGSELDEELSEFDWTLMGLYYSRTKLRNLARECAIQCQAQTTGVFLVEEALPVRGYLKEHMLSASPEVRKLPFMKQTVKQLLEGGMGFLRGIAEQFGRGAARGKAWPILAYGTVATVAFVEDRRQG